MNILTQYKATAHTNSATDSMATSGSQYCQPYPRGTLLVLVMSGLLYAVQWFVFCAIEFSLKSTPRIILNCTYHVIFVLLPVTGWVAESWLGRYRAILVGLILSAVTVVLFQLVFVSLQLDWTPVPGPILSIVVLVIGAFGFGSLTTNMLPFTLDQMIGAPAEELSAVVQWYYWGFTIGIMIRYIHRCISIPRQLHVQFLDIVPVVLLVLGSVLVGCPDNGLFVPQVVGH